MSSKAQQDHLATLYVYICLAWFAFVFRRVECTQRETLTIRTFIRISPGLSQPCHQRPALNSERYSVLKNCVLSKINESNLIVATLTNLVPALQKDQNSVGKTWYPWGQQGKGTDRRASLLTSVAGPWGDLSGIYGAGNGRGSSRNLSGSGAPASPLPPWEACPPWTWGKGSKREEESG